MTSIMTNPGAMTALQALKATNKAIDLTQNRISTGFRVSEAAHNAAYWSIATTMRSDNKVLSTVQDALGLGAGLVDTAYTATETVLEYVDQIKSKVAAATQGGLDRDKIQKEIEQLIAGIRSTVSSASYAGSNWLSTEDSTPATQSIVASFTRNAAGGIALGTIEITMADFALIDNRTTASGTTQVGLLENVNITWTPPGSATSTTFDFDLTAIDVADAATDLAEVLAGVDFVLQALTDRAANLGATKSRIDLQKNFVDNLMDALDRGIGQLVDADMEEESTRLQALQVQQQLGIQALSIANSNAQNILTLFRQ